MVATIWTSWLSDASGEYQLMVGDPLGITPARTIALPSTAFFSNPSWSPDGTHILLEDNHDNLWAIDTSNGSATKIDTDDYPDPIRQFTASWSPDSKWITYSKNLASHLRAVFVYSWADKKSYQVTDGLADSISPTFDASSKYLYFMMESSKEISDVTKVVDKLDAYDWYLRLGALSNADEKYFHGKLPTWSDFVNQPDYNAFWKRQAFAP